MSSQLFTARALRALLAVTPPFCPLFSSLPHSVEMARVLLAAPLLVAVAAWDNGLAELPVR